MSVLISSRSLAETADDNSAILSIGLFPYFFTSSSSASRTRMRISWPSMVGIQPVPSHVSQIIPDGYFPSEQTGHGCFVWNWTCFILQVESPMPPSIECRTLDIQSLRLGQSARATQSLYHCLSFDRYHKRDKLNRGTLLCSGD